MTAVAGSGWRARFCSDRWCRWLGMAGRATRSPTAYLTLIPKSSLVPTCTCIAAKADSIDCSSGSLELKLLFKLLKQSCNSWSRAPFAWPAVQVGAVPGPPWQLCFPTKLLSAGGLPIGRTWAPPSRQALKLRPESLVLLVRRCGQRVRAFADLGRTSQAEPLGPLQAVFLPALVRQQFVHCYPDSS